MSVPPEDRIRAREAEAREIIEGLLETIYELADNDELIWVGQAKRWLSGDKEGR